MKTKSSLNQQTSLDAKLSVGGNLFDTTTLEKRLQELNDVPPFTPDKYEPRYSVTQLFESGVEVTLLYVIRNGHILYYKSEQRNVF